MPGGHLTRWAGLVATDGYVNPSHPWLVQKLGRLGLPLIPWVPFLGNSAESYSEIPVYVRSLAPLLPRSCQSLTSCRLAAGGEPKGEGGARQGDEVQPAALARQDWSLGGRGRQPQEALLGLARPAVFLSE